MFALNGKIALVTGGSRSLGAGICESLGRAGAQVAVNCLRNAAAADSVVERVRAAGGKAAAFQADVTDEGDVAHLVDTVCRQFGSLDILVINATCDQETKPFAEQAWADYQQMIDFFIKSPFLLTKAVLPGMKQHGWGRIINIGSEVVELGNPEFGHYVGAKGAQLALTRSYAREFAEWGITVNLVAPGWIPVERTAHWPPEMFAAYQAGVPMKRQGTPADIGAAVTFLASPEANFITGQKIAVNGGNTLS